MKGAAQALFGVATYHRLVTGCDTHNRGVLLITGAVTRTKWMVTLVTHLYMRKNGGQAHGQDAVGRSWRRGG